MRFERLLVSVLGLLLLGACERAPPPADAPVTLVFKHARLFGDPRALAALVRDYEARHPGVRVRTETLPSSSDEQHLYYVINLRAGARDFDVFALDVIWVAEFARAGWLADLTALLSAAEQRAFFDGPMQAARYGGRLYAIPWFMDAGLLYYRKDLLAKHGYAPPRTWEQLARAARAISAREPGVHGFVWQGKQYEGLVCNGLEYMWSAGGEVVRGGRAVLDSPANRRALGFMRALLVERASPELVLTATEEPARRIFGSGRAVFMRNWPYAWTLLERPDSPVAGRVGIAPLPRFAGQRPAATLGGWHLGVNRRSRHPAAARAFVRFMTSPEAQRRLARDYGLHPARRAPYHDPTLLAAQPQLEELRRVFELARPRPVTPYYPRLSQVLQSELSAVIAGLRPPHAALAAAQRRVEAILAEP